MKRTTWFALLTLVAASLMSDVGPLRRSGSIVGIGIPPGHRASAQEKRIYLALDDHTDYMWTADEATYQQAFLDTLDYYLDLADQTANEPSQYQSRFNTDGTFWIKTYRDHRTSSEFQRLIEGIRSGHISVPLAPLVLVYGGVPIEAALRGMYFAGHLERQYGLSFPLGVALENQTLPYGLGALMAGSGARYSWRGICGCLSQVTDAWDREHDIYRWVGPDGSSLLMKWNSMLAGNQSMGGYAEARDPYGVVDYVDANAAFAERYPYSVIGAFGYGWDDLQSLTDVFLQAARTKTTSSRKVVVSNQTDFFEDFEATHGAGLPEVSVTFGNEWDTYVASMAEVTAGVRRATEKLRAAEAMATLVSIQDPTFWSGRSEARETAMMDLGLYFEHNWVGGGTVSTDARGQWQRRIGSEIRAYVDALHEDAIESLGGLIASSSQATRFFVFNPLGWNRDDYADLLWTSTEPVHVVDVDTGREVPSQTVTRAGGRYLRILAGEVPAVGYRVYEVREGEGTTYSDAALVGGNSMENDHYRVTVANRGAIASLVDVTRNNRELIKSIGGFVANDLGASSGSLEPENVGPVTATLKATAGDPIAHTTRVTFIRGSSRIEVENEITEGFSNTYTWKYSFNLEDPDVWHEEVGAVIRARLSTDGGQYSPRNARYDWLSLAHFADVSAGDGSIGVTLSAWDTPFFKLGNSSMATLDTATPQISPLAGGQVDGAHLGITNQGGDTYFLQRFALRAHAAYQAPSAMMFALEHQNPLVAGLVSGAGSAYPEGPYSLVTVDATDVLVWAVKPAEDGIDTGIAVRVWNLSSTSKPFSLTSGEPLLSASRATHIETPTSIASLQNDTVSATAAPQQLMTFILKLQRELPGDDDTPVGDDDQSPGDDDTTVGDDDQSPGDDDSPPGDDDDPWGCGVVKQPLRTARHDGGSHACAWCGVSGSQEGWRWASWFLFAPAVASMVRRRRTGAGVRHSLRC